MLRERFVTPYTGVWIEILRETGNTYDIAVTPYTGVWIEILQRKNQKVLEESLPIRECGLK